MSNINVNGFKQLTLKGRLKFHNYFNTSLRGAGYYKPEFKKEFETYVQIYDSNLETLISTLGDVCGSSLELECVVQEAVDGLGNCVVSVNKRESAKNTAGHQKAAKKLKMELMKFGYLNDLTASYKSKKIKRLIKRLKEKRFAGYTDLLDVSVSVDVALLGVQEAGALPENGSGEIIGSGGIENQDACKGLDDKFIEACEVVNGTWAVRDRDECEEVILEINRRIDALLKNP